MPKPSTASPTVALQLRIPPELHAALSTHALEMGVSMNSLAARLLAEALRKLE